MNPKEKLAALVKGMQDIVNKAKSEGRDLTAEETSDIETKSGEAEGLREQIEASKKSQALIAKIGALAPDAEPDAKDDDAVEAKSMGEHFVKALEPRLVGFKGVKGATLSTPEFKAATDDVATGGFGGPLNDLLVTTRPGVLNRDPRELTPVAALLGQGTITQGNAVQYFVEGPIEGDVDIVPENGAKPQLSIADPEPETAYLRKLAGWIRVTDEYFEDLPLLASRINDRLLVRLARAVERQVLLGTGTGGQLVGLLNTPGIGTLTGVGGGVSLAEAVLDATSMIEERTPEGLSADAVVLNRADYVALRKAKDANGQYYGGGFFTGAYGNGQAVQGTSLWDGLRVVVSSYIPEGTALVGAYGDSATIFTKGGVRLDATNSHAEDFTHNRVTVRAERRVALATEIPAGFVKITVADES